VPRKSQHQLQKVTILLREGDKEVLQRFFPAAGYSVAIRECVHQMCTRLLDQDREEDDSNIAMQPELDFTNN